MTVSLETLEIVGYADSLDERSVPHAVPPVFRVKGASPEKILFPPFHIEEDRVCGGTYGDAGEMESFVADQSVTRLDRPISPKRGYLLWIDQQMQPRYEPVDEAEKNLRTIASDALDEARAAMCEGRLDAADRLCSTALAADDRLPESLLIKAAIFSIRGQTDDVEAMRIVLEDNYTDKGFNLQVNIYKNLARRESCPAGVEFSCCPVKNIATRKPREALAA